MTTFTLFVHILWIVIQAVVLGFLLSRSVVWVMSLREDVLWRRANARGPASRGRRLIAASGSVIVLPAGNTGITSSSTQNV